MANIIKLGLRAFEFFWTLLIIALVGNMIHDAIGGNPSVVNYVMFTAVFSMLTLIYLILVDFREEMAGHPIVPKVLDGFNMLFFLIGGIAFAGYLGVHSCGNTAYITSNLVTSGSYDDTKRCHEAQASTAFLWFGFACYAVSFFMSLFGGSGSTGFSRGIRRGPAMSQV